MDNAGIFYATATGRTDRLVDQIELQWEGHLHRAELKSTDPKDLQGFDFLLLGSPTYGIGDLHHHWHDFLDGMKELDLSKKTVGLFVMADGRFHGDSFAGALGLLFDSIQPLGGVIRGSSDPEDYQFSKTTSLRCGGQFPGLVVDWSSPGERRKTPERITRWLRQLRD